MLLNSKSPPPPMWRILIARHEGRGFNCKDASRAEKMIVVGIWRDDGLRVLMNGRSYRPLCARGLNYLRKIARQSPILAPTISIYEFAPLIRRLDFMKWELRNYKSLKSPKYEAKKKIIVDLNTSPSELTLH